MATQVQTVKAELRERAGKGNARATRTQGCVPAVIYGGKEAPVMIAIEERVIAPISQKPGFFTHLLDIEAGAKKFRVIPRDVQYDPVTDRAVHVDFLRVTSGTMVRVYVPVVFVNHEKSPGLKRGGALNIVQHELHLSCSPDNIPEKIVVDLDGKNIGDTIHLEDIKLPADVKPIAGGNQDTTVASVAAPTVVKEEEAPTAAAAATADAAAPAAGGAAPAAGAKPGAAAPAAGAKPGAAAPAAKAPAKK